MYIFLDDERKPGDVTWIRLPPAFYHVVRNIDQFKAQLAECLEHDIPIYHISFDHDLADIHYGGDFTDEKTGFDCAKALVEWCMDNDKRLPDWTVHSLNPIGAENINSYLNNYKRVCQRN